MSDNKNSFMEKLKNSKVNRAAVVSTTMLLVAVLVIVGVTVASNRSKKNDIKKPIESDTASTADTQTEALPKETEPETKPAETAPPSSNVAKPVEDVLPSFSLPVKGMILKEHDSALQVYSLTMGSKQF